LIKYLIARPIAVIASFIVLLAVGLILSTKVPVSLLPDIDVPQIIIRVQYPNTAAPIIEENFLRPIRSSLATLSHISNVESKAANHSGLIYLTFEYGTKMSLAYIEANEKIDQLAYILPKDMQRPQVMRTNASDMPIVRIQVTPKDPEKFIEAATLTEKTLKKRIEQIEGVSVVDINGLQKGIINIIPNVVQLQALGIDAATISQTIQAANSELGGLSIADGQYRYFVKVNSGFSTIEMMKLLPLKIASATMVTLGQVASFKYEAAQPLGYHLYNGKASMVITVQKQPGSRMNELMPQVKDVVSLFKKDYPQLDFEITQDQSFLLDAGISNLQQDLVYGGILTILLLFLFLGNWASPILMGISIPLSLIITFIFFYLFNISFNIISLSGLALGIGMLIDNSIVVVDNITRHRKMGLPLLQSSIDGTNQVIVPVISQVLTTVAVYVPLVMLSGIAGALVYDQSIALTISLLVSLLMAFVLSPLLYKLFLKTPVHKLKEDTKIYAWLSRHYHVMISHILRHRKKYMLFTFSIMPVGIIVAFFLPVTSLPEIEKTESLVTLDWNMPVDAKENLQRIEALQQYIQKDVKQTEAEVGIQQFLLQNDNNTPQKAIVYYAAENEPKKYAIDQKVQHWLQKNYPQASFSILAAPNAFTQLFETGQPYLEARFYATKQSDENKEWSGLNLLLPALKNYGYKPGDGLLQEKAATIYLNLQAMVLYGVQRSRMEDALQQLFGTWQITEFKKMGDVLPVIMEADDKGLEEKLTTTVRSNNNTLYPLKQFVQLQYSQQPKFITADINGIYRSIQFKESLQNIPSVLKHITTLAAQQGYTVEFRGQYFQNTQYIKDLWIIFLLVLVLLYVILAIQYESLWQPLLVMLTIPLGITGGMVLLWASGGTLNVMAAIGFVVILGLIVDDPILKIETLNRLHKQYMAEGRIMDDALLEKMIHQAGDICLKPLLMVSLTTSIAMVPVLFIDGIGNDLQKPLSYVIIGGLTVGTFFTTWFIPLAYWTMIKWKQK